ncbi:MAG: monovalent cation/H(+) antiporter subunit G [Parvibaculaceae bacterium]|nr:monovalent cation/H(+) antiporter subunit G [Parvibaculaceae bacterium]
MTGWLELIRDIASGIAFAGGSVFILIGALGLLRLPDFWARLHAAGIIDTLGAELMLVGMMFQAGWSQATVKLALLGLFIAITGPTATHALANAAFVTGLRPARLAKDESHSFIPVSSTGAETQGRDER